VRSLASVRELFRRLHPGASRLSSSFDGLLAWRSSHPTEKGWFHVDQNPQAKPGAASFQALANLLPADPSTGGNVLVRGSHRLFPGHFLSPPYAGRLAELAGEDWLEVLPDDPELEAAAARGDVMMSGLGAGDVLLWDSRTWHCSYPPLAPPAEGARLGRAAVLVNMVDAELVTEEVRGRREQAVREGRTGTHWPDKQAQLGGERGEEVALEERRVELMRERGEVLTLEQLTEEMRELI
jgi:hypothetical protein